MKILINDTKGLHLVPGMSCTVKIHRNDELTTDG